MGRAEGIAHPPEAEEAGIRVRGIGEPAEEHWEEGSLDGSATAHAGGEGLQVAQSARRIGVAQGSQPLLSCLRCEPGLTGIEPRDRLEQRTVEELLVDAAYLTRMTPPLGDKLVDRLRPVPERPTKPPKVFGVVGHRVRAA
ncbi:unannotated protein [freshwater metagenome]|uniref:Unannotated protein n=1 Tax=freshwater metagenome TaxID=449393 RepID=A0A6J7J0G2_9ZZZZ